MQKHHITLPDSALAEAKFIRSKLESLRKFTEMQLQAYRENKDEPLIIERPRQLQKIDHWILSRTDEVGWLVHEALASRQFGLACSELRRLLSNVSETYVEVLKAFLSRESYLANLDTAVSALKVWMYIYQRLMCLFHPFMPYTTECMRIREFHCFENIALQPFQSKYGRWHFETTDLSKPFEIAKTLRSMKEKHRLSLAKGVVPMYAAVLESEDMKEHEMLIRQLAFVKSVVTIRKVRFRKLNTDHRSRMIFLLPLMLRKKRQTEQRCICSGLNQT